MRKQILDYELANGDEGRIRILAADKIAMERTMRTNSWPLEDGPRAGTLILYFALKREGRISANYTEFIENELMDYASADAEEEPDPLEV